MSVNSLAFIIPACEHHIALSSFALHNTLANSKFPVQGIAWHSVRMDACVWQYASQPHHSCPALQGAKDCIDLGQYMQGHVPAHSHSAPCPSCQPLPEPFPPLSFAFPAGRRPVPDQQRQGPDHQAVGPEGHAQPGRGAAAAARPRAALLLGLQARPARTLLRPRYACACGCSPRLSRSIQKGHRIVVLCCAPWPVFSVPSSRAKQPGCNPRG
jgi:hypothetical protein